MRQLGKVGRTMQANKLAKLLLNHTITHSGAERRTYLGMSQIGYCQRELYFRMRRGREWTTWEWFDAT